MNTHFYPPKKMAKKENNKHTIIKFRRYFLLFCRISLYQNQLQQLHVFALAQNRSIGVMRPAREFTLYTTKSGIWPPILPSTLVGTGKSGMPPSMPTNLAASYMHRWTEGHFHQINFILKFQSCRDKNCKGFS